MSRHFTTGVLLESAWPLDADRIAKALGGRFPQIGAVEVMPGQSGRETAILTIEGAEVILQSLDEPVDPSELLPPLRILRAWNSAQAMRAHRAHLAVTCGGALPGVEGAVAYAAATHFVTAAIAGIVKPLAVNWAAARALVEPAGFIVAADRLLAGELPLMTWISFAPVAPEGYAPGEATGMVTYGLRRFIGRELELAPRPGDPQSAWRCLAAIVRGVLGGGLELRDGLQIDDGDADVPLTVRERRYWLRPAESAFVLVADDAVVDPVTLRPRAAPAA